ncbi:helicase-related protein [Anaerotruncus rubiinfantis]
MAEKWQTISELAETTSRQVTQSPEQWRRFLATAGRFYKAYDFDDQLLIYAQKPDATACADMPTWNNKMRRWVNGGSTAIALIRKGYGGKPYLDYVHDVADTHPVRGGKDPWLWSMDDDSRMPVMERLREVFGAEGGNDLGDLLMDAAAKSVEDTYGDYLTDLIYEKEDSFLEELDDLNIEVTFRDTLRASVQYAVLTRCGLDASRYLDEEDLRGITNFNTIATLACLGTATAQVNRTILLEIGDTIRNLEREKVKKPLAKQEAVAYNDGRNFNTLKCERSDKDGIDIQQTERLSGAEPENGRNGRGSADPGPIRESQRKISDGTQERAVQYDGAQRQTVEAPDGDRQGGAGTGGRAGGGDGKEPGRERSPESGQSNGLGAENEQHQAGGGGSRAERPDLQLKKQEETAGVKPAVSSSAELEEPFSTQPAYRQMTLFDLPEVQIERIAQKEAEAAAPASSRSRQKKKEQPQGNPLEAARRNLFAESGKEDNQLSLDLAAMTGREPASGPDTQEAEPVPPRTLKEIYAEYQPVVLSRVLNDEAYQNALKNSDPENIRIEGDAAVKRAVLAVNEPELLRLYYDFPEFHTRLHKEVLEKAGAALTVSQQEAAGGGPLEAQKEDTQGKLPPQAVPVVESPGAGGSDGLKPSTNASVIPDRDPLAPAYQVGDSVYLEDTLFQVTGLNPDYVELLDPALAYPIFRSERIENFERLLRQDSRNGAITEFLAPAVNSIDADLREVLTGDGGLLEQQDKELLAECFRAGDGNTRIAQRLSDTYAGTAETMELVTGETADYFASTTSLEINIFDKYDSKRAFSWADLAPVLRSLYQAEQDGFFHEPVIQEPVTLQGPPSYQVGDSVHLPLPGRNIAGTIGYVGELDVRIDTGPYSWSHETISRPQFEEALRHDERNAALFPHVPDLTGQSITRQGDSLTIGTGPATHEIDITVTDEEWRQIKEAIPDQAEMQPEQAPAAENFHITDPDLGAGGQKTKFQNNVAAIRLLKDLESQGRLAAPEEQKVLARYVGWGGLPQAFDEANEKWAAEYAELNELLTPEEYASARGSTLNAHYTSPTVIQSIYEAVGRMGIQPETVLEPAMGVGNFFGLLPEAMQGATLLGVELDSITGRLAGQLYPQAKILVDGFEHTNLPDNSIDLAVGNVPFGNYKLPDPRYDSKNLLIHDYFFAKTLDKVRPGGIVAFISSKGTLDKQDSAVREYLAQKADLLGAVRLPNNAFAKNAGTEVTSDILFLQKRESPPEQLPEWVHLGQTADGIPINRYFELHPEMVLGTMAWDKSMYGNEKETTCEPVPGAALEEQLAAAIKNLGQPDQRLLQEKTEVTVDELLESLEAPDPMARNFSYTEIGGKLYFLENGEKAAVDVPAAIAQRIRGMIGLREITRHLIDLQLYDGTDEEIKQAQAKLNTAYDAFTAKFGLLNSTGNKRAFEQDSAYCLLCSLEILDEDGNLERKADMFTKRTINQQVSIDHVDTASEALAVSIGERACVDLGFMSTLLGRPGDVEPIIEDLKGVIFKNPEAGSNPYAGWETADEYLSGNVRKKLAAARAAAERDSAFADNVAALEQAQPKDLSAAEIDVRIGVTWIDTKYYTQFVHELLKTPGYLHEQVQARYSPATGEWNISGKSRDSVNNSLAYVTYGTKRRNAYAIIEDSLNLRDTRIYDTIHDPDGSDKRVLNVKETMLAQQKQEQIREAFKNWIWKDPERRADLCRKYNELYNAIRPRSYNGDHIRFSGMNPEISLRPHQRNAVARMLYGGNSLLAHCVGAGKTFEIVAAAIESKRLGLTKKSLVVVPNHLTEQWGADFLRLYPGVNVLVATKKDFEPANRKKFCSRIATGDYDAVVIGHSQFEKIPLSPERQKSILQEQIDQVIDGIQEAKAQDGERYTIKQLEKSRKSLEARMAKLNDQSRKDDVITFEELGVDKLYVDEAHGFKNLFLATKMRNVAGIGQSEAQKSSDMFAKCRYLDEITGGRGVVFATGTPVSNSMVELYTMMRYLQYDMLKESGLEHFDSWAANFGETITALEMAPEGTGFRSKTRFAKFFNLPELMSMWREAADIQTAEMLKLPVPEADKITVVTKPSDFQRAMVEDLGERADLVRTRQVEPRQDNMLKITSDGRKLALDQRLADPSLPDDPESKINSCVKNVLQVWRDTAEIKGTQLVFCDLSTPKNDGSFNAYDDIKQKLMAQGVPPEEIAYIHDAKTETQKAELFAKVRKGQVRVLLGSTAKMGAGTNVQTRLAALHHLDCPWRPADIEQREGRILRQGNMNEVVKIFKYVTENTFDAYNWSILENKQKFIGQLMSGKNPSRSCEDVDEAALSYAEVKALASGDPRIIEMTDLDSQVTKLKLLKANHEGQRYMLEDRLIQFFPQAIKRRQEQIKGLEEDIAHLQAHPQDKDHFSISLAGELYTERKVAGQAIIEACTQMKNVSERIDLGEYRGFPLTLWADTQTQKFQVTMKHSLSHTIELGSDPVGNMARLDHALNIMVENLEENRANLENLTAQMEEAKIEVQRSFPQEQELAEKSDRLNVLRIALNMDGKTVGKRQRETEELESDTQGGQPSIKGMLKRLGVESAATASPPTKGKDMEVAI